MGSGRWKEALPCLVQKLWWGLTWRHLCQKLCESQGHLAKVSVVISEFLGLWPGKPWTSSTHSLNIPESPRRRGITLTLSLEVESRIKDTAVLCVFCRRFGERVNDWHERHWAPGRRMPQQLSLWAKSLKALALETYFLTLTKVMEPDSQSFGDNPGNPENADWRTSGRSLVDERGCKEMALYISLHNLRGVWPPGVHSRLAVASLK